MKKLNIGILASVDSGKTTLSEAMLYTAGAIKNQGKIENKDTVLDYNDIERERGITVFSKIARLSLENVEITLIDTPGHSDFTYETEMVLNILDAAILIVGADNKVTGHTKTLWELLKKYNVPTFFMVNKLDREEFVKEDVIKDIKEKLTKDVIVFDEDESIYDQVIFFDDALYEKYMEDTKISDIDISALIMERKCFPIFAGSAIKRIGVNELLDGIGKYINEKKYGDEFGAFVYKINRDGTNRLTNMLITGGSLKVRDGIGDEKVHEIRLYNGRDYSVINEATKGMVVSVTGLNNTYAGIGIGNNRDEVRPKTTAVLTYSVKAINNDNYSEVLEKLKYLGEEDPGLSVSWDSETKEISIKMLGNIQMEILKSEAKRRFGLELEFGEGEILYKETIKDCVMGVGHFEPLRHYAEVCLAIYPLKRGMGVVFNNVCDREVLSINWQKLVMSHLEEKKHLGVLAGCELTDVCITLVSGKSHLKHTEGGDFREATYRAVRQGLMNATSILLEPFYDFTIMVPRKYTGKIMMDVEKMHGSCNITEGSTDINMIEGRGPVSTFRNYQNEIREITHGEGSFTCEFSGYDVCINPEDVIKRKDYNPDGDTNNPSGSIFCSHGAGTFVPWQEVYEKMHVSKDAYNLFKNNLLSSTNTESELANEESNSLLKETDEEIILRLKEEAKRKQRELKDKEKELANIFANTYGGVSANENIFHTTMSNDRLKGKLNGRKKVMVNGRARTDKPYVYNPITREKKVLIVDGYNVIFALDYLKKLAETNIDSAREELLDNLTYYQAGRDEEVIVVFDAYQVKDGVERKEACGDLVVYYTKENQTADSLIEQLSQKLGRKREVLVVSSDSLIRLTAMSFGCLVKSSSEFGKDMEKIKKSMVKTIEKVNPVDKTYIFDNISDEVKKALDELK